MLLSIIVLTLNSEHTIVDCLESIADQDFDDFEILLQDGVSTDKTLEIVNNFIDSYPGLTVRVQSIRDKGIYHAMNLALDRAIGQWIYFLGSDDHLYSRTTLNSVSKFLTDPFDVIYGDVYGEQFNGRYAGPFTTKLIYDKNICHQSIFVRLSLFKRLGNFNERYRIAGDWEFNFRWLLSLDIQSVYINLVIAYFSDAGVSSNSYDQLFDTDKPFLYIRYGQSSLSFTTKARLLLQQACYGLRRRKPKLLLTTISCLRYLLN